MSDNNEMFFWLDGWNGEAEGGIFLRNPLVEFFRKLEENGMKPVAIKYDGSWNLEIITAKNSDKGTDEIHVQKH